MRAPTFVRLSTRGLIACGVLLGPPQCRPAPDSSPAASPDEAPQALQGVLFYGCDDVRLDGACVVRPHAPPTIKVWVPMTDGSTVAVSIQQAGRATHFTPVDGGVRFALRAPAKPSVITVRRVDARQKVAQWRLAVRPQPVPDALRTAERLRRDGEFERARAIVEPLLADPTRTVQGLALGRLARIAMAQGDFEGARRLFERSIHIAERAGSFGIEIDDRSALAYLEMNEGRYAHVETVLAPIAPRASAHPAGARLSSYYEVLIASKVGDARRALRLSRDIMRTADRLGLAAFWRSAAAVQIVTLNLLERDAEAQALLRARWSRIPAGPSCVRADRLGETGWLTADVWTTEEELVMAKRLLRQAEDVYRNACRKPRRLAYAQVRRGRLLLESGDLSAAAALLAEARKAPTAGVQLRKERWLLAGELGLARRDPDAAIGAFRRLEALGRQTGESGFQWMAMVGRGRALEQAGRLEAAVGQYRAAERLLDRAHLQAPMGAGRGGFLRRHDDSAQRLVDLLLRLGRPVEAATAARHSRARALLTLAWTASLESAPVEARRSWYEALFEYRRVRAATDPDDGASWGLSRRKLRRRDEARRRREQRARDVLESALASVGLWAVAPRPRWSVPKGTLLLSFHPIVDGWAAFAITSSATIARRLEGVEPTASRQALARRLLAPFAVPIRRAERIQIAATDTLSEVAFHALPFEGRSLLWHRPVAYRVDAVDRSAADPAGGRDALVVAPALGLPSTQSEARHVAKMLRRIGWSVRSIVGEPLSRVALEDRLGGGRIDWFHYAGHAQLDGIDGWSSTLGTTRAPLWTVGDILAMGRGPRHVVLSACESAGKPGGGAQFGLGQAFIVAGAEWVVAATRPVLDRHASLMARALYRRLGNDGDALDPAAALRAAAMEVAAADSEVDWQSFVVLTR